MSAHVESIGVLWCSSGEEQEIGVEIGAAGSVVVIEIGGTAEGEPAVVLRMTRRKARAFAAVLKCAAEENGAEEAMAELPRMMAAMGISMPERPGAEVRPLRAVREKEEKKNADEPE